MSNLILPIHAPIVFHEAGDNITCVRGQLWQGATPRDGTDMSVFGGDSVKVFTFMSATPPDRGKPILKGCFHAHYPLEDNASDPLTIPPTVRGLTLGQIMTVAREVADRFYTGKPTVICCRKGYSRSSLIVGLAMRLLGNGPSEAVSLIRAARGPCALDGGNSNFSYMVEKSARV